MFDGLIRRLNIFSAPASRRRCVNQWLIGSALVLCIVLLSYLLYQQRVGQCNELLVIGNGETNLRIPLKPELLECIVPCPEHDKMRNDLWFVMMGHNRDQQIAVYGAYFDDRSSVGPGTKIRVFGVSSSKHTVPVYCQVWYSNFSEALIAPAEVIEAGRGFSVAGIFYQEQLYTCSLSPGGGIPQKMSLTFNRCSRATAALPVHVPKRPTQLLDVGVCVAVAYGYMLPKHLIEWIEMNKLQGVSQINVYESSLNVEAAKVFDDYKESGFLVVRQAAPPLPSGCIWCQKLATIAILNDCMYRNMYSYKYIMVIDFDEFIVPQKDKHLTIKSALADLEMELGKRQPGFMVRNAYFFLEFPPEADENPNLITMRYQTRLEISDMGYASKSIINPLKCVSVQNHLCILRTPDVGKAWPVAVSSDLLLLNHYKHCHYERQQCLDTLQQPHKDKTMLKYKKDLELFFNETVVKYNSRGG